MMGLPSIVFPDNGASHMLSTSNSAPGNAFADLACVLRRVVS